VQPTTITIITDGRPCSSWTGRPGTPPLFIKCSQQQGGAGVDPDLPAHDERSDTNHRTHLKHGPGPASLSTDLGDAVFPQALARARPSLPIRGGASAPRDSPSKSGEYLGD